MLEYYLSGIFTFILVGIYTIYNDYNTNVITKKINPLSYTELNNLYIKVLPISCFNMFILFFPAACFFPLLINNNNNDIPIIIKYLLTPFLLDISFYLAHRLFHTPFLYKFHKKHHELITPIGIGAFYMSSIEFYFGVIIPIFIPLFILGFKNIHLHIWTIILIGNAIYRSHSNIQDLSEFHNNHHIYFKYNYGIDIFMDFIFNTKYNNQAINIPISIGELFDRYSILDIKNTMITDMDKLTVIKKEIKYLDRYNKYIISEQFLYNEIKYINTQLWTIEDKIREKEYNNSFDDEFISLARSVYITNDERSKTKNKINNKFNCNIIDIKNYKKY